MAESIPNSAVMFDAAYVPDSYLAFFQTGPIEAALPTTITAIKRDGSRLSANISEQCKIIFCDSEESVPRIQNAFKLLSVDYADIARTLPNPPKRAIWLFMLHAIYQHARFRATLSCKGSNNYSLFHERQQRALAKFSRMWN